MNTLPVENKVRVLSCLCEGVSIRATSRITGVAKNTIKKLIREVAPACERFHEEHVRYLPTLRVQCDEVWSFVGMKQKNVPEAMRNVTGLGSVWTWTAMDADSKLMISWVVGDRDQVAADALMADLRSRVAMRIQISTDGLSHYLEAILKNFKYGEADHAEVTKVYAGSKPVTGTHPQSAASRYSPGRLVSIERRPTFGMPITAHQSTSYMERANLTIRMQNRRFTRLTNGFSKRFEMHRHALAITFFHYNFIRKHQTLKKTPAQAAHVIDYALTIRDCCSLRINTG